MLNLISNSNMKDFYLESSLFRLLVSAILDGEFVIQDWTPFESGYLNLVSPDDPGAILG